MNTTCMGGWCHLRDKCRHYLPNGSTPLERFCEAGRLDAFEPLIVTRSAGTWELPRLQTLLKRADAFDGLVA